MASVRTILSIMILLGGCRAEFSDRPAARGELVDQVWVLREVKGAMAGQGDPPGATLRFGGDHRIAGTEDCNDVFSPDYRWSADSSGVDGRFRPGPLGKTAVGCGVTTTTGERFWHAMSDARTWSARRDILTIRFADGSQAVLKRAGRFVPPHYDCGPRSRDVDCHR